MRVLLVEDAPRLAQAVAEILRGERYLVDVASTRTQAETLAATGAYDMILLDIMLPDGSGIDVLRGLRAAGDATPRGRARCRCGRLPAQAVSRQRAPCPHARPAAPPA